MWYASSVTSPPAAWLVMGAVALEANIVKGM